MPSQTTGMHPAEKLRTQRPWLLCSTTALPERRSVTPHAVKRNDVVGRNMHATRICRPLDQNSQGLDRITLIMILLPAKNSFAAQARP
jgi:hypothetical protein